MTALTVKHLQELKGIHLVWHESAGCGGSGA